MSMKDVRNLVGGTHFSLTANEITKINEAVSEHRHKMWQDNGRESIINHSFSSEGGVAIDYTDLGLDRGFGEMLHLRFYEKIPTREELHKGWDELGIPPEERSRKNRPKTYCMHFVLNVRGFGWDTFRYNKQAKEAIIRGARMLLNFVSETVDQEVREK